MSIPLPKMTVSVLDARLKLVSIPRDELRTASWAVTRCLAFRDQLAQHRERDPFFNLTLNEVELSIFADEQLVRNVFADKSSEHGLQGIDISEDTWLALQVESHDQDDGWETSGGRVRDISAPLAAEGISILFLSTYISDFLLIKEHRLELVKDILRQNSFYDHDAEGATSSSLGPRSQSPYLTSFSPIREHPPVPGTSSSSMPPPSLSRSVTGSVLLSDKDRRPASSGSRNRKESGSPAASPARLARRDRSSSNVSNSGVVASPPGSSLHRSLGVVTENIGRPSTPSPVGSPNTPLSPHMSPSRSIDGLMSSLELNRPRKPSLARTISDEEENLASPGPSSGQPRSYKKMQESVLSEVSTVSTAAGVFDKIALLPDELVCVGLRQQEGLWRGKILHAIFYTDDVLDRPKDACSPSDEVELDEPRPAESGKGALYGTTPTPNRPRTASSGLGPQSIQRTFSASTHSSTTAEMQITSTSEAPYPTPFLSLSLTTEGASLLADIRLLRQLFSGDDESLVYAPGQGGLSALWGGEEEELDTADERNASSSSQRGRSSRGSGPSFDDAEDWQEVPDTGAEEEDDSGRRLFKCLQLDLSSFGLEKAGLAHQFAGILTEEQINLLYSSTFRTANILVAKRHIRKARSALEAASR